VKVFLYLVHIVQVGRKRTKTRTNCPSFMDSTETV